MRKKRSSRKGPSRPVPTMNSLKQWTRWQWLNDSMNSMTMTQLFKINKYVHSSIFLLRDEVPLLRCSVQSGHLRREISPCEAITVFGAYTSLPGLSSDLELSETSSQFLLVFECRLSNPRLCAENLIGDSFGTIFVRHSEYYLSCVGFASRKMYLIKCFQW